MEQTAIELATLEHVARLLAQRGASYEAAIQTTVCGKTPTGWQNLLTKVEFLPLGQRAQPPLTLEYQQVAISRRALSSGDVDTLVRRLLMDRVLDTWTMHQEVPFPTGFSVPYRTRWSRCEWSAWPADVFVLDPAGGQSVPQDEPLISLNAPFFPSLDQVLAAFFGIRAQSWLNYFRGQVVIVLGDFRARIGSLVVGLRHLRITLETGTLRPDAVTVKLFAEGHAGPLTQETMAAPSPLIEFQLTDQPTLVCVALMCNVTGDTLDEKSFREGVLALEPDVIVEGRAPEMEQLIARGEGEAVEFKAKLDKGSPERIAKTAVAFANTAGGRIIFGIDDNGRIVGCEILGLADRVTNILRSQCDPPIACTTTALVRDTKNLLLVEIAASSSTVHVVNNMGPFIRANATNRSPTAAELALLHAERIASNWD